MNSPDLISRILIERCTQLDSQIEGYGEQLLETVVNILELEREHSRAPMNIQQKISDRLEFLGRKIEDSLPDIV